VGTHRVALTTCSSLTTWPDHIRAEKKELIGKEKELVAIRDKERTDARISRIRANMITGWWWISSKGIWGIDMDMIMKKYGRRGNRELTAVEAAPLIICAGLFLDLVVVVVLLDWGLKMITIHLALCIILFHLPHRLSRAGLLRQMPSLRLSMCLSLSCACDCGSGCRKYVLARHQ